VPIDVIFIILPSTRFLSGDCHFDFMHMVFQKLLLVQYHVCSFTLGSDKLVLFVSIMIYGISVPMDFTTNTTSATSINLNGLSSTGIRHLSFVTNRSIDLYSINSVHVIVRNSC